MTEQWQELKETITELRDNDGTATQQEVCKFLVNLMDVLEKQMQEPVLDKIRAEIEGYKSTIDKAISEDELKIEGMKEAYADCLEIIDKYKAESEE